MHPTLTPSRPNWRTFLPALLGGLGVSCALFLLLPISHSVLEQEPADTILRRAELVETPPPPPPPPPPSQQTPRSVIQHPSAAGHLRSLPQSASLQALDITLDTGVGEIAA